MSTSGHKYTRVNKGILGERDLTDDTKRLEQRIRLEKWKILCNCIFQLRYSPYNEVLTCNVVKWKYLYMEKDLSLKKQYFVYYYAMNT